MSKWITKPKVKYAQQYVNAGELPPGVQTEFDFGLGIYRTFVVTIHGQKTYVVPGDFIVQEPDGIHYYPCKPDIWLAGHEQMGEDE
jgi:hypothetical protein